MGERRKESLGKIAGRELHDFTLHQTILGWQQDGKQMGVGTLGGDRKYIQILV